MSEVDNVISSFQPEEVTPSEAPKPVANEPEPSAEPETAQSTEAADADDGDADDEGFKEWDEKRAKNRISRQDKRIGKLTWEKHQRDQQIAELQAQLSKLSQPQQSAAQQQPGQNDGAPREEDYAGRFDEYVVAKAAWQAEQRAKSLWEAQTKEHEAALKARQEAEHITSLATKADKAAEKFLAEVPDAISAQKDFEDLDLSKDTLMAVLSLEDKAPTAVYQLWKAGKLDELEGATPLQVQILLASALATPFTKPVSKAPAPVKSAKGSTSTVVNPDNYNPDELLRLIRKG